LTSPFFGFSHRKKASQELLNRSSPPLSPFKMSLTAEKTHSSELKNGHGSVNSAEPVTQKKAGFASKAKRHCVRFWWLHLIIFCVIFLIIALTLTYAGLPRIAQKDVDKSSLEFTELQFLEPTPDSMLLTQHAILHNPSLFTPSLDGFTVSVHVVTNGTMAEDKIMTLEMPAIHATKPRAIANFENQAVAIASLDELTTFSTQVLQQEEVTLGLTGKTKLHLGALPVTNVNYNEETTFKGLNGLKGFNVTGALVNPLAKPGVPNIQAFAYIPNPSVMTIAMGNVTLNVATAQAGLVGTTTILNMTLKPGNNTLPMFGELNQTALIGSMDKATGLTTLIIWGKTATYNGERLPYYEAALASQNLTLPMNVAQVIKDSLAHSAAAPAGDK
jgi:hypothetical protein